MGAAASADILGLPAVRGAIWAVLGYLPKLAAALAVLGVGGYVARVARRAVAGVMKELKSPFAGIAESLTEGVIMLVTITVCVNQLGADLSFITNNLAVILGALIATAALLFAWAMRRPAEEIIANYYLRRLVRIGGQVTLATIEGTVDRFAALGLVLKDSEGCEHFIPAHHVEYPALRIAISGHADNQGDHVENLDLSQQRAEAVKVYLVQHGTDASRIETRGARPDEPNRRRRAACGSSEEPAHRVQALAEVMLSSPRAADNAPSP
jgi:OmpA family/Conserved TM helix